MMPMPEALERGQGDLWNPNLVPRVFHLRPNMTEGPGDEVDGAIERLWLVKEGIVQLPGGKHIVYNR